MADAFSVMLAAVRARSGESGRRWLDSALETARSGDLNRLCGSYTAASRQAGLEPLAPDMETRAALSSIAPGLSCDHWSVPDGARAVLLLAAAEALADTSRWVEAATACFENGDAREQQSWLRGLSLMPDAGRLSGLAVEACRSHIQPLFESIACDNPYPAAHFSERQFNQLVLKAMFTGVRLERIVGLARRVNPELSRMARDYAAERRAAGRPIPSDLPLALHDAPALEERLS